MNKSFFKPKFRIMQAFTVNSLKTYERDGFVVEVKYWWFPVWVTATLTVIEGGKIITGFASFKTEEDAKDYISRRWTVYGYSDSPKLFGRHEQEV